MANEPSKPSRVESVATQMVGVAGVGSFVAGIHQVHPPSALIAGGLLALTWAILKARAA
jgi:hypothetical protein